MTTPRAPNSHQEPLQHRPATSVPRNRPPEEELDSLITLLKERRQQRANKAGSLTPNPIQSLRELTLSELIPIFVELVEKYSKSGVSMQMDASNFLEGGREIRFEFGIGEYRTQLLGTVTTEAIAFHETRYTPDVHGELVSGPMLRLRNFTGKTFRNFVCERLTILLRSAMRRR